MKPNPFAKGKAAPAKGKAKAEKKAPPMPFAPKGKPFACGGPAKKG